MDGGVVVGEGNGVGWPIDGKKDIGRLESIEWSRGDWMFDECIELDDQSLWNRWKENGTYSTAYPSLRISSA